MAESKTFYDKIMKISDQLVTNMDNFNTFVSNFEKNIDSINTEINSINTTGWSDDVEVSFSEFVNNLNNRIVSNLVACKTETGTLNLLKQLIGDLQAKITDFVSVHNQGVKFTYNNVTFDKNKNEFVTGDIDESMKDLIPSITTEELKNLNTQYGNMVSSIEDILNKLSNLTYDGNLDYVTTNNYDFSFLNYERPYKKNTKSDPIPTESSTTPKENNSTSSQSKSKTTSTSKGTTSKRGMVSDIKWKTFDSPDDKWIVVNPDVKLDDNLLFGKDTRYAFNLNSGEYRVISYRNDMDHKLDGFLWSHSYYEVNIGDKTVIVEDYNASINDFKSYIINNCQDTIKDKWRVIKIDSTIDNNSAQYADYPVPEKNMGFQMPIYINGSFYPYDGVTYICYNPITGETVKLGIDPSGSKPSVVDNGDGTYTIKQGGNSIIVYKENLKEYNLSTMPIECDNEQNPFKVVGFNNIK